MLNLVKEIATRNYVVAMAIGIIVGAGLGTVVKSLVADIVMPALALLPLGVDLHGLFFTLKDGVTAGPYASLALAQEAGAVAISYGMFLGAVISFIIVVATVSLLAGKINSLAKARPADKAVAPAGAATSASSSARTERRFGAFHSGLPMWR